MTNNEQSFSGHEQGYVFENTIRPFSLIFAHAIDACSGERYERKTWDCWTFEYIVEGSGIVEVDGHVFHPSAGDMYILPKFLPHSYQADKINPWKKKYFVVNGDLAGILLQNYGLEKTFYVPSCERGEIFLQMRKIWEEHSESMHDLAVLVFHRFLIELDKQEHDSDKHVSPEVHKALAFLQRSIQDPVTIDDIAAAACLSNSHLTRVFKKEVGMTPYNCLIAMRMSLAKDLLLRTDLTVTEISGRLCYADAFYFSNSFKKHTGLSPSHFRKAGLK